MSQTTQYATEPGDTPRHHFLDTVARDISQQQDAERKLRDSEREFRAIFELAGSGAVLADAGTGRFLRVNQCFCHMTGYGAEELKAMTFRDVTHPADQQASEDKLRRMVSGEVDEFRLEKRYIRKDGKVIWADVSATLLADENRTGDKVVVVAQDSTERKQIEQERKRLIAQLNERVKELSALQSTCELLQSTDRSIEHLLEQTAQLLPPALQYPELAAARVTYRDHVFSTPQFEQWQCHESVTFTTTDGASGAIEVAYVRPPVSLDDEQQAFIDEERALLSSIAKIIANGIDQLQAEARLRYEAFYDTLTGLYNRTFFLQYLGDVVEQHHCGEHDGFAVLFLDIDRFKVINDSLGHATGDELLQYVAEQLQAVAGQFAGQNTLTLARHGGDEFTVLVEGAASSDSARQIAEMLIEQTQQPVHLQRRELFTTVSIGITWSQGEHEAKADAQTVIRDADLAMYQAKDGGEGGYQVFDQQMHQRIAERLELENDLRRAIEQDQLEVHYQPIMQLETATISGVEALVRWRHPEYGMVSPGQFIPVAEDTGMIVPIGDWVLETAIRQLARWLAAAPGAGLSVAVNVASQQLQRGGLPDRVAEILHATGVHPGQVKLELTESTIIDPSDAVLDTLQRLRDLGIILCVDDFGTGYSSLSYLHQLPIDVMKIDRSFIAHLGTNEQSTNLVQGMVELAHRIGLEVIAEGIEQQHQITTLREIGCSVGQGFYFGRPQGCDDMVCPCKAFSLPCRAAAQGPAA
jgi:diguanylate cyclase (GGDEF)-like protein/PAS domain S-box-containing protein